MMMMKPPQPEGVGVKCKMPPMAVGSSGMGGQFWQ
jgi:hypothetical protein